MRISTASTLLLGTLRAAACPTGSSAIDEYIETERIVALEQLLCNIGDDGCNAAGADPGVVVASPSKSDPDCRVLFASHVTRAPALTALHRLVHVDPG